MGYIGNTTVNPSVRRWEFGTWSVNNVIIRRGDVFYADLRPVVGSEQGGVRPVLIIQNDTGNKHSPTVICAAITSKMNKAKLPTHVELNAYNCNMVRDLSLIHI